MNAAGAFEKSQRYLTLPVLAKFYPRTFARVMYTSFGSTDELEPDFEDEEGELFWPGQAMAGEGLGWVCLMGKSMISEFSKRYGYLGIEGVLPPQTDGELLEGNPVAPGTAPSDASTVALPGVR